MVFPHLSQFFFFVWGGGGGGGVLFTTALNEGQEYVNTASSIGSCTSP